MSRATVTETTRIRRLWGTLATTIVLALLGPLASSAHADSSCIQAAYSNPYIWSAHQYTYAIKGSSVPSVPGGAPIDNIIKGRHVWNNTTNTCGFSDLSDLTAYNQTSSASIGFSRGDGYNRIDFGSNNFSGCAGSVGCTALQLSGPFIQEVDTRFESSLEWRTDGVSSGHDIWNVSAHESGHAIGLQHASGDWLTMYYTETTPGELRKRTLACGDVRGLRSLYGGALPSC
jgi:hypothetical protein